MFVVEIKQPCIKFDPMHVVYRPLGFVKIILANKLLKYSGHVVMLKDLSFTILCHFFIWQRRNSLGDGEV